MGFWQNLIGLEEEDEDEEFEEEFEEEEKERKPFKFGSRKEKEEEAVAAPVERERKSIIPQTPAAPAVKASTPASTSSAKQAAAPAKKFTEQIKVSVIEPQSFEESPRIVDNLKARKPVIINLENMETDAARKIFDFLSGATYALNGNVQKISNNIFLFAPENVDVTYNAGGVKQMPVSDNSVKSPWN